jgi:hypothetical protein
LDGQFAGSVHSRGAHYNERRSHPLARMTSANAEPGASDHPQIGAVAPAADLEPEQLESVCILLGPYRNLTTLTCSVLSLHPQCLVLNHAGQRILPNPQLNFLKDYSPEKFLEFVRYAGHAARDGARGQHGGDIRLSHAFDFAPMRQAAARLGDAPRSPAKCLVWKESHMVTNFLRSAQVDVPRLLERNGKLRFLLPIRNPIDCALSNLRTGHVAFFRLPRPASAERPPLESVLSAVLEEIAWFLGLREDCARPERFFLYFEHEIGPRVLEKMLGFLGLPPDEPYLAAVADAFRVAGGGYRKRKDQRLLDLYSSIVRQKFDRYPQIRDALLEFARR